MKNWLKDLVRLDGWESIYSGFGTSMDRRSETTVTPTARLSDSALDELYHSNDLAQRIVRLPAEEATREWVEFRMDEDGEETGHSLAQYIDDQRLKQVVTDAYTWARLFGTSFVMVGADDGLDPAEPLNYDNIRDIKFYTILDKNQVKAGDLYKDPFEPKYGMPEFYHIFPRQADLGTRQGTVVHESRMLRFDGSTISPYRKLRRADGFSESSLFAVYEVIRAYDTAWSTAEILMSEFAQPVLKLAGLANLIKTGGEAAVRTRLAINQKNKSTLRTILIDADKEDYSRMATPLGGLPEMLDRYKMRVSSATQIPQTLLFGMSPGGLSGEGTSEAANWANYVKTIQEDKLRPELERLFKMVLNSQTGPTNGQEPESWSFIFRDIRQPTPQEEAALRKMIADTDAIYLDRGVLLENEVALSRFGGSEFSPETIIDRELRDEALEMEKEQMLNPPPSPAEIMAEQGDQPEPEDEEDEESIDDTDSDD